MINMYEVSETNKMIEHENLDVRTITLGISLLDCIDSDLNELNRKIYEKITKTAENLVSVGQDIETEFGIPIVNKRISVTPIALVGAAACRTPEDFVTVAKTLDRAAETVGVNFIGGYSALVSKSMTKSEENLIRSIPQALAETERICSSVNVGSTKTGINMDAVRLCGRDSKSFSRGDKRERFSWVREAGDLLQCPGRQSVHGGCLPRRDGRRCGDQCRSQRSGSCKKSSGKGARQRV